MHNLGKEQKGNKSFSTSTITGMNKEMKMPWGAGGIMERAEMPPWAQKAAPSEEPWTVSKASCLPRLRPSGPRNILHSSICPKGENITRISFSLHFLDIIPINNFLSSTAKKSKDNSITSKYVLTRYYFVKSSPATAVMSLLFRGEAC